VLSWKGRNDLKISKSCSIIADRSKNSHEIHFGKISNQKLKEFRQKQEIWYIIRSLELSGSKFWLENCWKCGVEDISGWSFELLRSLINVGCGDFLRSADDSTKALCSSEALR
jgi:hypothetical protein